MDSIGKAARQAAEWIKGADSLVATAIFDALRESGFLPDPDS